MQNQQSVDLTPEQRQANIDRMITAWKARKQEMEADSVARFHSPEFQQALAELRKQNAERGTPIISV